jgi:hypothetical protein
MPEAASPDAFCVIKLTPTVLLPAVALAVTVAVPVAVPTGVKVLVATPLPSVTVFEAPSTPSVVDQLTKTPDPTRLFALSTTVEVNVVLAVPFAGTFGGDAARVATFAVAGSPGATAGIVKSTLVDLLPMLLLALTVAVPMTMLIDVRVLVVTPYASVIVLPLDSCPSDVAQLT